LASPRNLHSGTVICTLHPQFTPVIIATKCTYYLCAITYLLRMCISFITNGVRVFLSCFWCRCVKLKYSYDFLNWKFNKNRILNRPFNKFSRIFFEKKLFLTTLILCINKNDSSPTICMIVVNIHACVYNYIFVKNYLLMNCFFFFNICTCWIWKTM